MAHTVCTKCGGSQFELKNVEPDNSKYMVNFVQCAQCGTPFGVLEYHNLSHMLENVQSAIAELGSRQDGIDRRLDSIEKALKDKKKKQWRKSLR